MYSIGRTWLGAGPAGDRHFVRWHVTLREILERIDTFPREASVYMADTADLDGAGGVAGLSMNIAWILFIVGIVMAIFQQFVGITVIFYYSYVLWQAVGFSADESAVYTVITSVILLFG